MIFLELVQKRVSVRDYITHPIEDEKINQIMEMGRLAPSAHNYQPWRFVVITSEKGRDSIFRCYPRDWIKPVPLFILVCGNRDESWKRKSDDKDHLDIDLGIVIEQLCLAATDLDLGSCIICNFDTDLCRTLFNMPENIEPEAILSIGYPADPDVFTKTQKKRKGISEIVLRESF
ncbi:MAG: nitroreductase family protein [Massilibacteroides sp.]|nr:nitroreductase family protein [Massilibacteroides sp.]